LLHAISPLPHNALAHQIIGRWQLEQEIGRGGMAVVYRARNTEQAQHTVALKLMQPHRDNHRMRERFTQEVLLQAKLNHPQLAQFFDAGSYQYGEQTLLWLAMRWVEGVAIDRWCDAAKLDVSARVKLFLSVCDAISYAHSQLVVHCDLKPSNILIEQSSQRAVVLDFGIAAWMDGDLSAAGSSFRYLSPAYAAPEQFSAAAPSTAMDIHGLGATLYQAAHPCVKVPKLWQPGLLNCKPQMPLPCAAIWMPW
jgi:eukaryotic-like serine/threonine-protein kinase